MARVVVVHGILKQYAGARYRRDLEIPPLGGRRTPQNAETAAILRRPVRLLRRHSAER